MALDTANRRPRTRRSAASTLKFGGGPWGAGADKTSLRDEGWILKIDIEGQAGHITAMIDKSIFRYDLITANLELGQAWFEFDMNPDDFSRPWIYEHPQEYEKSVRQSLVRAPDAGIRTRETFSFYLQKEIVNP